MSSRSRYSIRGRSRRRFSARVPPPPRRPTSRSWCVRLRAVGCRCAVTHRVLCCVVQDSLSKKSCLRDYSNPAFFFEQWVIAEEERQRKLQEEQKARKANRKGRGKKKRAGKKREVAQVRARRV